MLATSMLLLLTLSAAAQAPAPAAPAAPKLDSGDTAWMLTSMALVLMMTVPGLALFYGGMVRKMNVLATGNAELCSDLPGHRVVDDYRL